MKSDVQRLGQDPNPELTRLLAAEDARRDREAAVLVAAWPGRMRLPTPDDIVRLLEVMEG